MDKDKQKVWDRLKYVPPDDFNRHIIQLGRRMGKSTIEMQAFSRAFSDMQDKK